MKDESNTSIYQEIMTKRELFKRKRTANVRETKTKKIERKCMETNASYSNRLDSSAICL